MMRGIVINKYELTTFVTLHISDCEIVKFINMEPIFPNVYTTQGMRNITEGLEGDNFCSREV
jgi:hypothetical protein